MEELSKIVNLLYIIHEDSILMRKFTHQNYDVIDVFNCKDEDDIDTKLIRLFGKSYPYRYFGHIENIIQKSEVIVNLTINAYKVILDKKYEILYTYSDNSTKNGKAIFWLHKDEISNERRLREGDKKVLERIFEDREVNIKLVENQGDRWIDAETVFFESR